MPLPPNQVFYVSPAQIDKWRQANEAVIVDVREQAEWNEVHIPNAILMPLSTFDPSEIPDPHGKHLVFYCRSGRRCGMAAEIAVAAGYTGAIKRMEGGMIAWTASGFESESD
jgi:rhodanese-related sulfurtransferase